MTSYGQRDPVAAPAVSGSPPADDGTGKAVGDEVQDVLLGTHA